MYKRQECERGDTVDLMLAGWCDLLVFICNENKKHMAPVQTGKINFQISVDN